MADIVLKDKNGNPIPHAGAEGLRIPTADGGFQVFGSNGWVAETVKVNTGSFTPSSNAAVVDHNLGVVPDFIFVGRLDTKDIVDRNRGFINWVYGWSRRIVELKDFDNWAAMRGSCIEDSDGDTNVNDGFYYPVDMCIDEAPTGEFAPYGLIHEANSTSFKVGDSRNTDKWSLHVGQKYFWFAISGLGVRMNQTSEV